LNALDRTEEVASDAIQLLKIRPKAKFFKETVMPDDKDDLIFFFT
jgi:hypothetical protein